MKKDTDLTVPSPALETTSLYIRSTPLEDAEKLFALRVDLEEVLERKKARFRSEVQEFITALKARKAQIEFRPTHISTPVYDFKPPSKLGTLVRGVIGQPQRVRSARFVSSQVLYTKDVDTALAAFASQAHADFEKLSASALDAEQTIRACVNLASERLSQADLAVLKIAVRRTLARVAVAPWRLKCTPLGGPGTLRDPQAIAEAIGKAEKALEQMLQTAIQKAQSSRQRFESEIDKAMAGLSAALLRAWLERQQMGQALDAVVRGQQSVRLDPILDPYAIDAGSVRLISPPGQENLRRLLLGRV